MPVYTLGGELEATVDQTVFSFDNISQVSCYFEVNQKTVTISFWKVNVFMMSENSTFTWWQKHYVCVEELHTSQKSTSSLETTVRNVWNP